jgi:hypothetical protein
MVMLSETNAWKKIGGKRCWQASSTSTSTARNLIHISSSKSCVFSNPSLFNVCSFSVFFFFFFIIFPPSSYLCLPFSFSFFSFYFFASFLLARLRSLGECRIANVTDPASWLNLFRDLYKCLRSTHTHTHTLWLQIPPIKKETIISIKIATSCYISREKLGHSFWLCIFNPKTAVMLTLGWSLEKPKKLRKDELLFRLFFLSSSVAISYFFWSANHRESNLKLNTDPTFSR